MTVHNWVCLFLLALIIMASLCLIPTGHGPYSAVYGPKAPLRAYRASLLLMQALVAIVVLTRNLPMPPPGFTHSASVGHDSLALAHFSSLPSTLRC